LGKLRLDGRHELAITAYCVHTFFDAYLAEDNVSPLQISSPLYPEIQVFGERRFQSRIHARVQYRKAEAHQSPDKTLAAQARRGHAM